MLHDEPVPLASAQVRRISELKWASFPFWIRKSIPALHGPGLIHDVRMIVFLRNTTLACN